MADAQAIGFPIRYASPGFEQVYGYRTAEIMGKKCGDLIGGPAILANRDSLASLASIVDCPLHEAEACIRFLIGKAGEACRDMMDHSGERVAASLLVNRKKSGVLFVCECLILNLRHPTFNYSYCMGFQRDVSHEVSLQTLLAHASEEAYARLLQTRSEAQQSRCVALKASIPYSTTPGVAGTRIASSTGVSTLGAPVAGQQLVPTCASRVSAQPRATAPGHLSTRASANLVHSGGASSRAQQSLTRLTPPTASPVTCTPSPCRPTSGSASRIMLGTDSVIDFLSKAGLQKYTEPLLLSGFDDMETLISMTDNDMKDLGIPRGHAAKLRKSLRAFDCRRTYCSDYSNAVQQQIEPEPGFKVSTCTGASAVPSVEEKSAVERSWARIQDIGVTHFGEMLFEEFFRQIPETMALFPAEVCDKYWDWTVDVRHATSRKAPVAPLLYAKVTNLIGASVIGLHDSQCLVQALVRLGARHATYGVKEVHLGTLAKALIETLRTCLGENFTPDVELAWSVVFNFITATMAQGMQALRSNVFTQSPKQQCGPSDADPETTPGVVSACSLSTAPVST